MGISENIKQYGVEPNRYTCGIMALFISILLGIGIVIGYFLPH